MVELKDDAVQAAFRETVRSFIDTNSPKNKAGGEADPEESGWSKEARAKTKDWRSALVENGWIAPAWPKEYGGAGLSINEQFILNEELAENGLSNEGGFGVMMLGPTLMIHGSEEQKAEHLPKILKGDVIWCQGWSEPGSGSDLASLQTRAVRDGDEYVLNGQKIWTSFGAVADYCYLICRTKTEGPPHRGISELIVPMDLPGIEVRPITDMTENRHFCEVYFTDVHVPIENLVGVEGEAFKQTMRQLEHERGGIDRLVSNKALYDEALKHADTGDPLIRQEISTLESGYSIGKLLVYREVLRQAPAGFSAATKCFCTEHEWNVAQFVSRILGPEALLDTHMSRGLAYAPAYTIMGGTSNIMRNILGERCLGLDREPRG